MTYRHKFNIGTISFDDILLVKAISPVVSEIARGGYLLSKVIILGCFGSFENPY